MTTQEQDFWGDIGTESTPTPSMILKTQASLLGQKTKHTLDAQVHTRAIGDSFYHSFDLVVPTLDNYTYELFEVSHGVELYPVVPRGRDSFVELKSEDAFKEWVHHKLSSPETKKILANLLSIARS